MTKKKMIKQFEHSDKYFVGSEYLHLTSSVNVYEEEHKFLFWKWKTYSTSVRVPYIHNPFYDGEYSTNRQLHCIEDMLTAEANDYIQLLKEGNL